MATAPYPSYSAIAHRLEKLLPEAKPVNCQTFRMVNPRFSKDEDIISGLGSHRASGRWHLLRLFRCMYLSKQPETALREVLAAIRRKGLPPAKALPQTIVCVDIDITKALDLTDGTIRQRARIGLHRIKTTTWWQDNYDGREAFTQAIGRAAAELGYEGIIAPSAGDQPHGVNFIIFPGRLQSKSKLTVISSIIPKK